MNLNRNVSPDDPSKPDKRQKFLPNNRYFTICIYAVTVILLGALIVRVVMTPFAVTNGIKRVLNVLMPFLMGVLIAMIMNPIINRLCHLMEKFLKIKKKKVCRILASILAYVLVLGLILICIIFIVPQVFTSITELVNSLPEIYRLTTNFFNNLQQHFPNTDMSEIQKTVNAILPNLISTIRNFASDIVPAIYSASISIVQWVLNAIVALIVSIYILGDKKSLKKLIKLILYSFVPEDYISGSIEILRECNNIFTNFMVSKALDSLIIGCLCFILMTIFDLDYAVLISMVVGITNMIPYFGPFIGAIPGFVILLIVNPWKSLGFLVLILILQQFDGLYLGPKLMGNSVGMKPLWIIVSITLGGKIAGVLGMFLSVPIGAILVYLFNLLIDRVLIKKNIDRDKI